MKRLFSIVLVFAMLFCTGCSNTADTAEPASAAEAVEAAELTAPAEPAEAKSGPNLIELEKYVFEVEEYTELDYEYADEYFASFNDNWGGGCSAVSKMVDGHRLVGRNMDLNISNKCAYIVRTDAGKYRTLGLAYTFRDYSPDYEDVKANGISEHFYKILPFMCDDVVNDAGLHVEVNMRHGEYWPNGEDKFACSGTNPDSDHRVFNFELARYIGENCATVEEAKEYISTLDVYSQNHYWNYCFIVSDSLGNSSLLEFSMNEVYWFDEEDIPDMTWLSVYNMKAIAQTNFFLNELSWNAEDMLSGEGRFIALQEGIDEVNSRSDMYDLMRKVQYSSFYLDYDECMNNHFDPRSENLGEFSWAVYDVLMSPEMKDVSRELLNEYTAPIRAMSRQEKQDANEFWESTFTEVVDVNTQEIFVRMFENEDILYLIDFDGTHKINSISDWA